MTDLSREELYEIPIERLNMSVKAINVCLRTGANSVGDCIDAAMNYFFPELSHMGQGRWNFWEIIPTDIIPALEAQGYLKLTAEDFPPEIIEELKNKLIEKGYLQYTK